MLDQINAVISRMGNGGCVIRQAALLITCRNIEPPAYDDIAVALGAVLERYSSSGHATSSFAAAGTVLRTVDSALIKGPVLLLACAVAFSRVYLLVHYPSDILGGMLLGLLSAYAVYRLFLRGRNTAGSKTP